MKIVELKAYPTSFPLPPEGRVTLGIGRAVKRDAVVVKVTTEDGIVGWGESHHGRAPGAVAHLVNTTLRQLVLGLDAADVSACGRASTRCSSAATVWEPPRPSP
jgi:D-galactarolactone cycloisomerase